MAGVTVYVREALQELGDGASVSAVKEWIREKYPTAPQSQISLAMRKVRLPQKDKQLKQASRDSGSLFSDAERPPGPAG